MDADDPGYESQSDEEAVANASVASLGTAKKENADEDDSEASSCLR